MNKVIHVYKEKENKASATDLNLLVSSTTEGFLTDWNVQMIVDALIKEAELIRTDAEVIAKVVEERVVKSGVKQISVDTIRCIVNDVLFENGFSKKIKKQQSIGIPTYNLNEIIFNRNSENSNIGSNNPEAVNLAIAEVILKKYALENVFTKEIADAHQSGRVHVHDLGYAVRVYAFEGENNYIKIRNKIDKKEQLINFETFYNLLDVIEECPEKDIKIKMINEYEVEDLSGWTVIEKLTKIEEEKDIFEVELENGEKVYLTEEHTCIKIENNEEVLVQTKDLQLGDNFYVKEN